VIRGIKRILVIAAVAAFCLTCGTGSSRGPVDSGVEQQLDGDFGGATPGAGGGAGVAGTTGSAGAGGQGSVCRVPGETCDSSNDCCSSQQGRQSICSFGTCRIAYGSLCDETAPNWCLNPSVTICLDLNHGDGFGSCCIPYGQHTTFILNCCSGATANDGTCL
jgi:hypothetical protein